MRRPSLSLVLAAAAMAFSGAAFAQTAPAPSQKPPTPGVADSVPKIAGTVAPQGEPPFFPPLEPQTGVAADKTPSVHAPGASGAPKAAVKAAPQEFKPVEFGKLVVQLQVGDAFFLEQQGPACFTSKTLTYSGGVSDYKLPGLKEAFDDEFTSAGLKVAGDPRNLFESTGGAAEYVIAGIASEFHQEVCSPNPLGDAAIQQKGKMHLAVDWQVYSTLERKVVLTVHTSADYAIDAPVSGGGNIMANKVFGLNARQLAASDELRALLAGKPLAEGELIKPKSETPIYLDGALSAQARGVDAEIGSVVVVRSPIGLGSGFLVSKDGYILTAAHVVRDATSVKIRWSDKEETAGQVVRISKGRDVALIKTDPRGRDPLALRRDAPPPGATVFAIGAPYGQELQGTVMRGVLSATRVIQGYSFIQSDVAVNHGNSGGPLLDEQGRVIGICDAGITANQAQQGLNFFVPVGDALDFLSLQPR
jgi:S1-C subfamily serine protease